MSNTMLLGSDDMDLLTSLKNSMLNLFNSFDKYILASDDNMELLTSSESDISIKFKFRDCWAHRISPRYKTYQFDMYVGGNIIMRIGVFCDLLNNNITRKNYLSIYFVEHSISMEFNINNDATINIGVRRQSENENEVEFKYLDLEIYKNKLVAKIVEKIKWIDENILSIVRENAIEVEKLTKKENNEFDDFLNRL